MPRTESKTPNTTNHGAKWLDKINTRLKSLAAAFVGYDKETGNAATLIQRMDIQKSLLSSVSSSAKPAQSVGSNDLPPGVSEPDEYGLVRIQVLEDMRKEFAAHRDSGIGTRVADTIFGGGRFACRFVVDILRKRAEQTPDLVAKQKLYDTALTLLTEVDNYTFGIKDYASQYTLHFDLWSKVTVDGVAKWVQTGETLPDVRMCPGSVTTYDGVLRWFRQQATYMTARQEEVQFDVPPPTSFSDLRLPVGSTD